MLPDILRGVERVLIDVTFNEDDGSATMTFELHGDEPRSFTGVVPAAALAMILPLSEGLGLSLLDHADQLDEAANLVTMVPDDTRELDA